MINRPSYAQRTLEQTRRSLQFVPVGSASSGGVPSDIAVPTSTLAELIDLQSRRRVATRQSTTADGRQGITGR